MNTSFFEQILEKREISKHNGRALWQYDLSDDEYQALKEHLCAQSRVDFRDYTLYYAEWWKSEYSGGSPSKQSVYNSVGNCKVCEADFYSYAKKGAVSLGIKWIKRENTLKFRTLLLQGGLPINHILNPNNAGAYTNFLKRLIEIRPDNISEFAYNQEITRIIPTSSRNETIYESSLEIVKAIREGNEEYLKIFEGKNNNSFKKITDELRKHNEEVKDKVKKITKFKSFWQLDKADKSKNKITLEFIFPNNIEKADLAQFIDVAKNVLASKYKLFINDTFIYELKRNLAGNYRLSQEVNSEIIWQGEDITYDAYLVTNDGKRYEFSTLNISAPSFSTPSLWVETEENKWILKKGKSCTEEKGIILFDQNWKVAKVPNDMIADEQIVIQGKNYQYARFESSITLENVSFQETLSFRTKATTFDWFVNEHKPSWLLRSSIPIIRNNLTVWVYDKDGQKIPYNLSWRLYGAINWSNHGKLPMGCVEIKIEALGNEETDFVYNLGDFNFDFERDFDKAVIKASQDNFTFDIKADERLEIDGSRKNLTSIELRKPSEMPKSIGVEVTLYPRQRRNLQLELIPPFRGIRLLSPEGNLITAQDTLIIGKFNGYRILAAQPNDGNTATIYNPNRPSIKIIKTINKVITPLREYEDLVQSVFRLSDVMNKDTKVVIKFEDSEGNESEYTIKNHSHTINYRLQVEGVSSLIELSPTSQLPLPDLYAVPLDCAPDNIEVINLEKHENGLSFPEDVFFLLTKFIVFADNTDNSQIKVLPSFVKRVESENDASSREERINNDIEGLKDHGIEGKSWKKLRTYYTVCINNDLPFSTFDVFRAASAKSSLAAKMFCVLAIYNTNEQFIERICPIIESDLGFCFHWIPKEDWKQAIDWIKTELADKHKEQLEEIITQVHTQIKNLIADNEPFSEFKVLSEFMVDDTLISNQNFHINTEIPRMRQSLGEKVLNQLPQRCPSIPEKYKNILPVDNGNFQVKILLKSPLAVALSIKGIKSIWDLENENAEEIRRNIQYCQWLAPEWYAKALLYCLSKI